MSDDATIKLWQKEVERLSAALLRCEQNAEELSREYSAQKIALKERIQHLESLLIANGIRLPD